MPTTTRSSKATIAIAGAGGFVGRALRSELGRRFNIVALTRSLSRSPIEGEDEDGVTWRRCDLFDPDALAEVLEDVDILIYLVHSMSPQSRLTQARFENLDLLLADNVRIATEKAGVKRIVYLGGLGKAREGERLSQHLESRREVGNTLGAGDARLTRLRAGLVIGAGGSSLRMMVRLIQRLPAMVLPRWTTTPTQPIALVDVIRAFEIVLNEDEWSGTFDLGIDEKMTYGEMVLRTAHQLGRRPFTVSVPISSPKISTLWVMLFSGEPKSLVLPLVASLKSPTLAEPNRLLERLREDQPLVDFNTALDDATRNDAAEEDPRRTVRRQDRVVINNRSLVRSIQRMKAPEDWSMERTCGEYWRWLGRWGRPLLKVTCTPTENDGVSRVMIRLFGLIPLLHLERDEHASAFDREIMSIRDGLLVRKNGSDTGRFEFRFVREGGVTLAALQDYAPNLPWYFYGATQARLHLLVMGAFRGWLRRRGRKSA